MKRIRTEPKGAPLVADASHLHWQTFGRCADEPLELFFGKPGERKADREIREEEAKAICGSCTVRTTCLDYALEPVGQHGVWGGMTADERIAERRNRQRRVKEVA